MVMFFYGKTSWVSVPITLRPEPVLGLLANGTPVPSRMPAKLYLEAELQRLRERHWPNQPSPDCTVILDPEYAAQQDAAVTHSN
jgi:hypothetical protein